MVAWIAGSRKQILSILASVLLGQQAALGEEAFDFFEQEAKVTTASRHEQSISDSPVPVEVITADDIKKSGCLNIWNLMRFRAGMDVIDARSSDGNRAIVGVRGFPDEFVSGLLVLVDGRSVYSSYTGGVYWQEIPVDLQNIERIEIVRGPNAALYGSNAALGVINIITKTPQKTAQASVTALGGNRGFFQTSESAEGPFAKGAVRFSHTYRSDDGFPDSNGNKTNDAILSHKANFRGDWRGERASLQVLAGMSYEDEGLVTSDTDQDFRTHYEMLQYEQKVSARSSIQMVTSRNDMVITDSEREYQYDTELLHKIDWGHAYTTWGGSYRNSVSNAPTVYTTNGARQRNQILRGFANQSMTFGPKWALAAAVSLEQSDVSGTEPAYQAAVIRKLNDRHRLRFLHAQAPIIPAIAEQKALIATPSYTLVADPHTRATQSYSYDAGYQGDFLHRRLQLETNIFYITQRDLTLLTPSFQPPSTLVLTSANVDHAIARGAEFKFNSHLGRASYYANYTFETISDDGGRVQVTKATPKHKANLGGSLSLGRGWTVSANCGYKDGYIITSIPNAQTSIPAYWRIDGRLEYEVGRYDFFVFGQNLARPQHKEFSGVTEVPRRIMIGATVKFGDSH